MKKLNIKNFLLENKKKLIIISLIILLVSFLIIYLINDYNTTKKEKELKTQQNESFISELNKKIPEVMEYAPEKGELIYLNFVFDEELDKNENVIKLMNEKEFRQSLFHGINRENIKKIHKDFMPSVFLFTKEVFLNNKMLPKLFFASNQESQKIYEELEPSKNGYNLAKALNLLEAAWNKLRDSEKKENYEFIFKYRDCDIDENIKQQLKNIQQSITNEINNLFSKFIEKNNLKKDQLILKICDQNDKDDFYIEFKNNTISSFIEFKDFLTDFFGCTSDSEDFKLNFNFKDMKDYLDEKKKSNNAIQNDYDKGTIGNDTITRPFPPLDDQGYLKTNMKQFWNFYDKCIKKLFSSTNKEDTEDEKLKNVKQKTYEEIFEKIFNFIARNYFVIPMGVV